MSTNGICLCPYSSLSLSSIPPPLSLSLSLPVLHVFSINYIRDNRSPNEMKRPGQVTHPSTTTQGSAPTPTPILSRVSRLSLSPKLTRRNFVLYSCTVVAELKFPREGGPKISPGKHYRWNDESGLPGLCGFADTVHCTVVQE